ncbi:MAG: hypothetical protein BWK80_60270 [Desulfobacteraceae bacterium IS3]|nr:MAG: hypothetical protein BWK80_60270 [Desulfobacteraceae bacterium IS3]
MKFRIVTALLIVMFSVGNAMCQEGVSVLKEKSLVLACSRPETQYVGKWQRLILTEVFRRLGIKAEFRNYPSKRATIEADAGNVDGEPTRPYHYADEHPNLLRVEESLFDVNYCAFAVKDSIPHLNGWESLKGTGYRVEYTRGIKISETNLPKVVSRENLSNVTEQVQGLKKLISDRTDLFVDEEFSVLIFLQSTELRESKIRSAGVMGTFPVYSYLHKKHAALALKMAEIIKAMKAEGLIEQYRMTVDKEFGVVRK